MRVVVFALALWLSNCALAQAHGEADWIRKLGIDCCAINDCQRAPDGKWMRIGSGFYNAERNEWVPETDTQPSIDESYWECRYNGTLNVPTGGGRCLFVPSLGF